ncbi:MAG TPA: pantoate--beta-alanine ligase, partial [Pseudomonadales bacterium]|nr:pantoate--beta-alanine ligase [Pseudomonadales bacterium]
MKIIDSVNTYREMRKEFEVKKIGFVPTMGALHIGHAALIERSVAECDVTVLSIYLNPTQFDNIADLEKYPATVEADLELAKNLGIEIVLMPDYEQMYPDGFRYQVEETQFSHRLCGAHRTGHFTGVLTVV